MIINYTLTPNPDLWYPIIDDTNNSPIYIPNKTRKLKGYQKSINRRYKQ